MLHSEWLSWAKLVHVAGLSNQTYLLVPSTSQILTCCKCNVLCNNKLCYASQWTIHKLWLTSNNFICIVFCIICFIMLMPKIKKFKIASSSYPMIYMSVFPSPTFSPNKEVMSSGGMAEPTFHVIMCTLGAKWEIRDNKVHLHNRYLVVCVYVCVFSRFPLFLNSSTKCLQLMLYRWSSFPLGSL